MDMRALRRMITSTESLGSWPLIDILTVVKARTMARRDGHSVVRPTLVFVDGHGVLNAAYLEHVPALNHVKLDHEFRD